MSVDTTRDTLEDFLDINLLNRDDELTISDLLALADSEKWMPSHIPAEYSTLALDHLYHSGIYDRTTRSWVLGTLSGQPSTTKYANQLELAWTSIFNHIVRAVDRCAPRSWIHRGNSPVEGRCKPDIVLVPSHFNVASDTPTQWTDILVTFEVKYTNTPSLQKAAESQLHDLAYFILSSQVNREVVMSFTLCGPSLHLFLFSRNGYFKSSAINVNTEPGLLVKLVAMATCGDCAWLGYDKAYHGVADMKYVRFQGKFYRVLVVLFHAKGLKGRGTRVLLVQEDGISKPFILKDTYHNVDWATDGDIYGLLQDQGRGSGAEDPLGPGGEQGLPVFFSEEVAPLAPIEELVRKLCPSSQHKQVKRHLRVAFKTLLVGITWFSCTREFLDTFIDAVEAHEYACRNRKVLHCDIS